MEKNNNTFEYTYSARQQAEINEIRKKYLPDEEDKLEKLRRLDKSAEQKGTTISIMVGIISVLIFGTGMCCVLEWGRYAIGIIVGIVGACGIAAAYPIFRKVTDKQRKKIAPEILKLTDELQK